MNQLFSINNTALTMLGYAMSWLELLATLFTVACVWLAMKNHILNWPVAIIAIVLSFLLFYQSALYADSFLQVYFLITSFYGWWYWRSGLTKAEERAVTSLTSSQGIILITIVILLTIIASYIMIHLNVWWPEYFPQKTAYPIPDSFIMVTSIAGQWLLAKKKLENWYCWIAVNCTAIVIYYLKDLKLFSLLYFILLAIAIMGVINWKKQKQSISKS